MSELTDRLLRVVRKPPAYVLERAYNELRMRVERYRAPWRSKRSTAIYLANGQGHRTVAEWWDALAARKYPATLSVSADAYSRICPEDSRRIMEAAANASANQISLLGSGEIALGPEIDWHRDYKSGYRWATGYFSDLEYGKPYQSSDVKFPWELSRLQWLVPVGQAYLLTGDDRYAAKVKEVLASWIRANPYGQSINWSCTMEVALRIVTMTWFFHVFKHSSAWNDTRFRSDFLRTIYLHGDFTSRHLEKSDINGNHYTADAAGLVYAGLFFGHGSSGQGWLELGWGILCDEIPKQVFEDGPDFEGSTAYHRLVQELFLLPAIYRQAHGMDVPAFYRNRLIAMARFTAAYSRRDGSVPLLGDADDARVLPFGGQDVNDHRYLLGLVGSTFAVEDLISQFSGSPSELFWLLGEEAATALGNLAAASAPLRSVAFRKAGYFVMRNEDDHVFVACAQLGLGGRGGHSHNDTLSFEATLLGAHLVTDCGAYVYTLDYAERNRFRSTSYHNTPQIDGAEINRFISPNYLWGLRNDAQPEVREVAFSRDRDRVVISHTGFSRLPQPVTPVRTLTLCHSTHRLTIEDAFEGSGAHRVEIPMHLATGADAEEVEDGIVLTQSSRSFLVSWEAESSWTVSIEQARISPSYGVWRPSKVLRWRREGRLSSLKVDLAPL